MAYLIDNKEYLINMTNHLNRKSIADTLIKVLISAKGQDREIEIKKEIFLIIIKKLKTSELEVKLF